jgi:DnaJ-class molecular chaperone
MCHLIKLACDTCGGKRFVIPDHEKCSKCNGEKVLKDSKIFTLDIERGAKWGDNITFFGEVNFYTPPANGEGRPNARYSDRRSHISSPTEERRDSFPA